MQVLKDNGLEYSQRPRKTSDISIKDIEFAKSAGIKNIGVARTQAIKKANIPWQQAAKMTLKDLVAKAAEVPENPSAPKRNWAKFEKEIAAGINKLFKSGFFVISKDGK